MRLADEEGVGTLEIFPLSTQETVLEQSLSEVFGRYWNSIRFGTLIQGAVFEIAAPHAPVKMSTLDGYFTVDFGTWAFHLCIGEHRGWRSDPVSRDLALHRRTARAELYRIIVQDKPTAWGLRMFNGGGEQQITITLPNPLPSDSGVVLKSPDWQRLALWDGLHRRYRGMEPDPRDRLANRFEQGPGGAQVFGRSAD